jgi:CspA family cold shock protein
MPERGRVKWFNIRAGWGFIERARGGDVFVRHDAIQGDGFKVLRRGEEVEFTLSRGPHGPHAVDVVRLNGNLAAHARPAPEHRLNAS